MRNKPLFQKYRTLCHSTVQALDQHHINRKYFGIWYTSTSDSRIYRVLREFSGIDKDSNSPLLASQFGDFINEALKNPDLSRLYSRRDLEVILIYHLQYPVMQLAMDFDDPEGNEVVLTKCYSWFEDRLYEENWTTSTIYPLVNFHSEYEWKVHQQAQRDGAPIKTVIADNYTLSIDTDLEIKQLGVFTEATLIGKQDVFFPYHTLAFLRDFTGSRYVIRVKGTTKKNATSRHNLLSYAIGRRIEDIDNDILYAGRTIVDLPNFLLLALRLFKVGDVGVAPYRYVSDCDIYDQVRPLYMPGLYPLRFIDLAQVEVYPDAPYVLAPNEQDKFVKLYKAVTKLLVGASNDLEHINIAQHYFQYSYSHKLTDQSRLQDRVVSLIFALEALLLEKNEGRGRFSSLAQVLIDDPYNRVKKNIEDAYNKVRNCVAHGREPEMHLDSAFVKRIEGYVRQAIRRAMGLAIYKELRKKDDLRNAIKAVSSRADKAQLCQDGDAPFA